MSNYKTFGFYLKQMLQIIIFFGLLAWLCSCSNRKQKIIDIIHAYNDSIGLNKVQQRVLQLPLDSITNAYAEAYPPTFFSYADSHARAAWRAKERSAFKQMLQAKRAYQAQIIIQQIYLESQGLRYQRIVDSLKLELYN